MNTECVVRELGRWRSSFIRAQGVAVLCAVLAGAAIGETGDAVVEPDEIFARASRIAIVLDPGASDQEVQAAQILADGLQQHSAVQVRTVRSMEEDAKLHVLLGRVGGGDRLDELCVKHEVRPPGKEKLYAEGYAVKTVGLETGQAILAVGADNRGVLYAVGEICRQARPQPDAVHFGRIDVSTSPAYRYRGFSPNQGGSMARRTGARSWTQEELLERLHDSVLAGGNAFYAGERGGFLYDYLKSCDLLTVDGVRPNQFRGEYPKEWRAGKREGWEGVQWVCPSIPEARAALLKQWADDFAARPAHDIMRFYAGDPGGCKDDRCMPWGKTFVHLCEEVGNLWLDGHPDSIILIANQDLSNEGDQAIFDYLNEQERDWLYGICYGPGSNALSRYFRDELREDLFEYPGHGPTNRYLALTLHELPKHQQIVHFSDITHWISAQYMVDNPDPCIVKSYGRRTFHARPRAFYRIFQLIMPFSEGDVIYSEGHHDEFHQYLWARLLWDPHRSLEDVMAEYCRLYFGEAAVEPMVQALLQLEENLETPLAENDGIGRYYALVQEAGKKIPPHLMEDNYRWRLHMQKAALDKYNQLKLRRELDKEERVRLALQPGINSRKVDAAIEEASAILEEPPETAEMAELREDAGRLGDETEHMFGVRNIGYSRIDQNLRDIPRIQRALEKAKNAGSKKEKRQHIEAAIEALNRPVRGGNIFW